MGTGTATMPWQSPVSELNEQLTPRYQKHKQLPTVEQTRDTFRAHQILATITMLDGDGDDFALIALTKNGWLVRIALSDAQCLDLARALLAKVRAR
jgi:hypothetical protein